MAIAPKVFLFITGLLLPFTCPTTAWTTSPDPLGKRCGLIPTLKCIVNKGGAPVAVVVPDYGARYTLDSRRWAKQSPYLADRESRSEFPPLRSGLRLLLPSVGDL